MEKVIVISCTARPGSNTLKVSKIYQQLLLEKGIDSEILDLHSMPGDIIQSILDGTKNPAMEAIAAKYVVPNRAFIFVIPEYNGGFPGLLKIFIDSIHPKDWNEKNVCLVGVSVGRAGNLRGMEHLTGILQYLKMHVFYNKLPISLVDKLLGSDGQFNNAEQLKLCSDHLNGFLRWLKG
jgi:chromate reductase